MKKILFVFVVTYLSSYMVASQTSNPDRDKKINQIFGKLNVTEKNPDAAAGDEECECVPYYLCTTNNSIITNGMGLIDIRESSECPSYLEVCCNTGHTTDKPIEPPPVEYHGCGFRNPDGVGFRIKGDKDNEAQFGEFPWMVAILSEEFSAGTDTILQVYKCGGALIHPQAVLTAAHCVSNQEKKYKIRAGEWDTQTTKELYPHQDRNVRKIVIRKDYYAGAVLNDAAILFLDEAFKISSHVSPLCLPSQDFVVPAGTKCFASGWGKDVFGKDGKYQVILKKVDLPMVEFNDCQDRLRTTRLGRHFNLDKSFVCAGGEPGKDTCRGDGGSPLACPIAGQTNRYQHIGMVAWGIGCGENNIPGVYVNVAMFRHWVDEQMNIENLDIKSYKF